MDAMRAAADHELQLVIRRVKRELDKAGVSLRYVAVTSDMTETPGRRYGSTITWSWTGRRGTLSQRSGPAWAAWTGSPSPPRWTTRPWRPT